MSDSDVLDVIATNDPRQAVELIYSRIMSERAAAADTEAAQAAEDAAGSKIKAAPSPA